MTWSAVTRSPFTVSRVVERMDSQAWPMRGKQADRSPLRKKGIQPTENPLQRQSGQWKA